MRCRCRQRITSVRASSYARLYHKKGQIVQIGPNGYNAKLQLRTVEQILGGQHFDTPPVLGRQQKAQQQLVF